MIAFATVSCIPRSADPSFRSSATDNEGLLFEVLVAQRISEYDKSVEQVGDSEPQLPGKSPAARPGVARKVARSAREAIRKNPKTDRAYRTAVGVVGTGTTALGVVLIPLPGPGALVAIGGLSILATEFETAAKTRDVAVKGAKAAAAKVQQLRDERKAKQQ